MVASPDGSRRLSHGVVVETSILARLFGFRLLRLEGTVVLSPAEFTEAASASASQRHVVDAGAGQAVGGLSTAMRLLQDSAVQLDAARQLDSQR